WTRVCVRPSAPPGRFRASLRAGTSVQDLAVHGAHECMIGEYASSVRIPWHHLPGIVGAEKWIVAYANTHHVGGLDEPERNEEEPLDVNSESAEENLNCARLVVTVAESLYPQHVVPKLELASVGRSAVLVPPV